MAKKQSRKRSVVPAEHWKEEPDAHDYPAASDYLSLLADAPTTASLVAALKDAPLIRRKGKDLLRASRLPVLPETNPEVVIDLKKVRGGERLSPVLLVRGVLSHDAPLVVADGYHRICASYHLDDDADIPCRIVGLQLERPERAGQSSAPSTVDAGDESG